MAWISVCTQLFLSCLVPHQVRAQRIECAESHQLANRDSLEDLARIKYGRDQTYSDAIWLATNAHSEDESPKYTYIADPRQLPALALVCVPPLQEAKHLQSRYNRYQAAVNETNSPQVNQQSANLITIKAGDPVAFVSWVTKGTREKFPKKSKDELLTDAWIASPQELWLTVVPEIKTFCQTFGNSPGATSEGLRERLEEKLGLPPATRYEYFVELLVEEPSKHVIRPCWDRAIDKADCPAWMPSNVDVDQKAFIDATWNSQHNPQNPMQYPWTRLGYTFDWGNAAGSDFTFVRFGATEFYVPQGTRIKVIANPLETAAYCAMPSKSFH
jgi:hypothetical protein